MELWVELLAFEKLRNRDEIVRSHGRAPLDISESEYRRLTVRAWNRNWNIPDAFKLDLSPYTTA